MDDRKKFESAGTDACFLTFAIMDDRKKFESAGTDACFLTFAIMDDRKKFESAGTDACFLTFAIMDDRKKFESAGTDACFLTFAIMDDRKNKECCYEPRQAWICPQAARHDCAGELRGPDVERLRTLSHPHHALQRAGPGLRLSDAALAGSDSAGQLLPPVRRGPRHTRGVHQWQRPQRDDRH